MDISVSVHLGPSDTVEGHINASSGAAVLRFKSVGYPGVTLFLGDDPRADVRNIRDALSAIIRALGSEGTR